MKVQAPYMEGKGVNVITLSGRFPTQLTDALWALSVFGSFLLVLFSFYRYAEVFDAPTSCEIVVPLNQPVGSIDYKIRSVKFRLLCLAHLPEHDFFYRKYRKK